MPRALPPCDFPSRTRALSALAEAVRPGGGLVALVGPPGSGKTYALMTMGLSAPPGTAVLRRPGQAVSPAAGMDLLDGLGRDAAYGKDPSEVTFLGRIGRPRGEAPRTRSVRMALRELLSPAA